MTNGRKMNAKYENPIDNILLYIFSFVDNYLYKLNFTPNMLTFISLVLSLIGIYYIHNKYYRIGAILIFIGYLFDCADGNFARKYNMVTKNGDYFDHISDLTKMIILYIIILTSKLKYTNKIIFMIVNIIFIILFNIHMGCQECIYNSDSSKSSTLDYMKYLCPEINYIKYTRYVGCGTFFLVLCVYLYNMKYINTLL
jgi:phosphatidylglycerophosphate synthase